MGKLWACPKEAKMLQIRCKWATYVQSYTYIANSARILKKLVFRTFLCVFLSTWRINGTFATSCPFWTLSFYLFTVCTKLRTIILYTKRTFASIHNWLLSESFSDFIFTFYFYFYFDFRRIDFDKRTRIIQQDPNASTQCYSK